MKKSQPDEKDNLVLFEKLYQESFSSLCYLSYRYTQDLEAAKDITHNVFVKHWECYGNAAEIENEIALLKAMVKNASLNYIRSERIHSLHHEQIQKNTENFSYEIELEEETYRLLNKAISVLPARTKDVITLSMQGYRNPEIAEKLQISINTVKTLKYRAVDTLKSILSAKGVALLLFLLLD